MYMYTCSLMIHEISRDGPNVTRPLLSAVVDISITSRQNRWSSIVFLAKECTQLRRHATIACSVVTNVYPT